MAIQKGKTQFLMGIDKTEQLVAWLNEHPMSTGVAFVGRSNVGKSSIINRIFGAGVARVSNTPGRTRQVNIFSFEWKQGQEEPRIFYLFDLPGYGHAEVSKEMAKNWQILLDLFFQGLGGRALLLNIQDARHPLQETDKQFHNYLRGFRMETYLVFNKMDKLKTQKERAGLQKLMPDIYQQFKWVKQIHFTSAEKNDGIQALSDGMMNYILRS